MTPEQHAKVLEALENCVSGYKNEQVDSGAVFGPAHEIHAAIEAIAIMRALQVVEPLSEAHINAIAQATEIGYVASGDGDYGDNLDAIVPFARAIEAAHTNHPARHWDRTCPACNASIATGEQP